jgi:hypothetical protein
MPIVNKDSLKRRLFHEWRKQIPRDLEVPISFGIDESWVSARQSRSREKAENNSIVSWWSIIFDSISFSIELSLHDRHARMGDHRSSASNFFASSSNWLHDSRLTLIYDAIQHTESCKRWLVKNDQDLDSTILTLLPHSQTLDKLHHVSYADRLELNWFPFSLWEVAWPRPMDL